MSAKDKGNKTANEIMEAAIKCVATIGIENTSMAEIGKVLDVNRSLVAYHFPKKEDIFFQITEYILNDLAKFIENTKKNSQIENEIFATIEKYFSLNHNYLVTFINFLYYCNLEYRYYIQFKELINYLKTDSSLTDQSFELKLHETLGKLVTLSMEMKYK